MFGFGAKDTINATGSLIEKTGKAFDSLFTSDEERLTRAEAMERIKQKPSQWAHELNVINAKDKNRFNSGWRPMIGWVLGISIACYFIPKFVLGSVVWCVDYINTGAIGPYPIDDSGLWTLAAMMIGGQAVRSFDKFSGTAK